jgi:hypothetical protein
MVSLSIARAHPEEIDPQSAIAMLSALEGAHERLSGCIAEMGEVTLERSPDRSHFTRARFLLSSASRARRQLFNSICDRLLPLLVPADARCVQALQQNDRKLSALSTKHVAEWSSDRIQSDWASYCRASQRIRQQMLEALTQELRELTALLHRCADRGGTSKAR